MVKNVQVVANCLSKTKKFLVEDLLFPEVKNEILMSPKDWSKHKDKFRFFFTLEGGSRKFVLKQTSYYIVPEGVGYVFYRGRYIKSVKLE